METNDSKIGYSLLRSYHVTPDKLFASFVDEETLIRIWKVSSITIDARPGGRAIAKLQFADENWDFTLTYKEVVPNEKLRWVVQFDRFPAKEIHVTLWFKAVAGGAELTVRQENFESEQERDHNRQAWEGALTILEQVLDQDGKESGAV